MTRNDDDLSLFNLARDGLDLREAYRRFKSGSKADTVIAVALVVASVLSIVLALRSEQGDRRRGR